MNIYSLNRTLPATGILKKATTANGSSSNGVKHCAKLGAKKNKMKEAFLFDAVLEAKLASMNKEAANQTAINSLYNQFLGLGKLSN